MTLSETDLHPSALRSPPDTTAGLLERSAMIRALRGWLSDVDDDVRDRLEAEGLELEKATGGVFNLPVSGVGRALMTDPSPRARVTNGRLFAEWLADNGHDELYEDRIEVKIAGATSQKEHRALAEIVENPETASDLTEVIETLRHFLRVDRWCAPAEDALEQLLGDPDVRVDIVGDPEQGLWVACMDEDGQPTQVPGTEVSISARRLQVRVEADHKKRLRAMIESTAGPPELEAPHDE